MVRRPRRVRTGAAYPYDELERLWRTALLLQFHDILPGSSIAWVHREAERDLRASWPARAGDASIGTALRRAGRRPGTAPVAFNAVAVRRRRACRPLRRRTASPGRAAAAARGAPRGEAGTCLDERAPAGRGRRPRPGRLGARPGGRPRGARRPAARTCSSCTRTPRTASTPGTSTALPPRTGHRRCTTPTRSTYGCGTAGRRSVHVVRRSGPSSFEQWVRLAPGSRRRRHRDERGLAARRDAAQGRVPARRARRPLHLGDRLRARAPARRTRTPAGTPPGSRSARTGGSTSASRATAWRWSTTRTYGHDVTRPARRRRDRARRRCGSRWRAPALPRPGHRPRRHAFRYGLRGGRGRSATPSRRATALNLPLRRVTGGDRSSPLVRVDAGPRSSRR